MQQPSKGRQTRRNVLGTAILAAGLTGSIVFTTELIGRHPAISPAALASPAPVGGAALGPRPVIVELFTSEGCSDCPPADKLLSDLARRQPYRAAQIIPMEEHVDYFNNPWRDPFSSHIFTHRQDAYAFRFNRDSDYTPEMVVDGQTGFVGSDGDAAASAIRAAAHAPAVSVTATGALSGRTVTATVQVGASAKGGSVTLAVTEDGLTVRVGGGENAGRRLVHDGVVRWIARIGSVGAAGGSVTAPVALGSDWAVGNLHLVAYIDSGGPILGAATAAVR